MRVVRACATASYRDFGSSACSLISCTGRWAPRNLGTSRGSVSSRVMEVCEPIGMFSSFPFFTWVNSVSRRMVAIRSSGTRKSTCGSLPDAQCAVGEDVRSCDGSRVHAEDEQDGVDVHDQEDAVNERPVGKEERQDDGFDDAGEREAVHHGGLVAAVGEDRVGAVDSVLTAGGPPEQARHDPQFVHDEAQHGLGRELGGQCDAAQLPECRAAAGNSGRGRGRPAFGRRHDGPSCTAVGGCATSPGACSRVESSGGTGPSRSSRPARGHPDERGDLADSHELSENHDVAARSRAARAAGWRSSGGGPRRGACVRLTCTRRHGFH